MQEEVTQRTIALCVEATRLSAGMLQQAMKKVLDEMQKACVSYLFTAGGAAVIRGGMDVQPFAAVIPRLYEMPEK